MNLWGKRSALIAVLAGSAATGIGALTRAHLVTRRDRAHHLHAGSGDPASLAEPNDTIHRILVGRDGAELHVVERGPLGAPVTLLLLHGVGLAAELWNGQLSDLGGRYRVLAMDLRAHGSSRPGRDGCTLDAIGDDIAEVIERLRLRNVIIVGHSMGGMALLRACSNRRIPKSVVGLVLTGSAACAAGKGFSGAVGVRLAKTALGGRPSLIARLRWTPSGDMGYLFFRGGFGANPSPVWVELCERLGREISRLSYGHFMSDILEYDERGALGSLGLPLLVLAGSQDALTPEESSEEIIRLVPHAELRVAHGAGHMLMLERRQWWNEAVVAFAERTTAQLLPAVDHGHVSPGAVVAP